MVFAYLGVFKKSDVVVINEYDMNHPLELYTLDEMEHVQKDLMYGIGDHEEQDFV